MFELRELNPQMASVDEKKKATGEWDHALKPVLKASRLEALVSSRMNNRFVGPP